jgi:hypothetical protein
VSDDEYRGAAVVRGITVAVRLSARFEPVEGRYRWAGRAAPDEALTALLRSGIREATVRIADVEAPVALGEPDPWGGVRLTGTGLPPWRRPHAP